MTDKVPGNDGRLGTGLSAAEAARRLAADGPNQLPGSAPKSTAAIVWSVLTEPMFLMLLAAGGIYLALGDRAEALFLLGFVFVVIGITLVQERRTQRALESLRDLSAPRALVIRDGQRCGSRGAKSCAATCLCYTKATAFRLMRCCRAGSYLPMNRYSPERRLR
jgi:hypothetical protein